MEQTTGQTEGRELLKVGQYLWKEGETKDVAYLIEEGAVALYLGEKLVGQLSRGLLIGCASVLLERPQLFAVRGAAELTLLKQYAGHALRHHFTANADLAPEVQAGLDAEACALRLYQIHERQADPVFRVQETRSLLRASAETLVALVTQARGYYKPTRAGLGGV